MHEAGIAQNLIEAVQQRLASEPGARVAAIHVRVGELSGVSTDALDFAFECLAASTPLSGARLVFDPVPLVVACDACGQESPVEDLVFRCGVCGSERTRIVSGRELEVRTLELEDETEVAHARD
ncbi:MAG TPA: hydrogenase maturation nickel metallochaperone HypA [Gemmatimonadales bacterium]|nr:hydrogenase maturation nickel metallochaperone HypA [Gemmatimonadales bacterium]